MRYFPGDLVRHFRGVNARMASIAPHGEGGVHDLILYQFPVAFPAGRRGGVGGTGKKNRKEHD